MHRRQSFILLGFDNFENFIYCSFDTCRVLSACLCKVCLATATTLHLACSLAYYLAGVDTALNKVGTNRDCQLWLVVVYAAQYYKQVFGLLLTQHECNVLNCCRCQR